MSEHMVGMRVLNHMSQQEADIANALLLATYPLTHMSSENIISM